MGWLDGQPRTGHRAWVLRISRRSLTVLLAVASLATAAAARDLAREAKPPASPAFEPPAARLLFADDFSRGLGRWRPDQPGVWSIQRDVLKAELPDQKQARSFLYAGDSTWTDYVVQLDVCQMRGVDKGVAVRVRGDQAIAIDLRGPGYHDILMQRREWPMGSAKVINGNGMWHRIRFEARGHRYRAWVNGALVLDRTDRRKARPSGGIALPAYTGGVGECTVYYDNVIVTEVE